MHDPCTVQGGRGLCSKSRKLSRRPDFSHDHHDPTRVMDDDEVCYSKFGFCLGISCVAAIYLSSMLTYLPSFSLCAPACVTSAFEVRPPHACRYCRANVSSTVTAPGRRMTKYLRLESLGMQVLRRRNRYRLHRNMVEAQTRQYAHHHHHHCLPGRSMQSSLSGRCDAECRHRIQYRPPRVKPRKKPRGESSRGL